MNYKKNGKTSVENWTNNTNQHKNMTDPSGAELSETTESKRINKQQQNAWDCLEQTYDEAGLAEMYREAGIRATFIYNGACHLLKAHGVVNPTPTEIISYAQLIVTSANLDCVIG